MYNTTGCPNAFSGVNKMANLWMDKGLICQSIMPFCREPKLYSDRLQN